MTKTITEKEIKGLMGQTRIARQNMLMNKGREGYWKTVHLSLRRAIHAIGLDEEYLENWHVETL